MPVCLVRQQPHTCRERERERERREGNLFRVLDHVFHMDQYGRPAADVWEEEDEAEVLECVDLLAGE
jgi:hypothetical protein